LGSGGAVAGVADEVLVQRIRDGDESALSVLYRRHVEAIFRFVRAQVRDGQEAEDLTSETFARMIRGIAAFRGEASFRNWLYQIARNAVRNHRRSAAYRLTRSLPATIAADPDDTVPDDTDDLRMASVLALLQPLPPRYRQVLELRFLEGVSLEETAARMQITVANAKVLQHRALRKAAGVLEEVPHDRR
jgi:RNA polymerase sigma factor (sigma-70 family)